MTCEQILMQALIKRKADFSNSQALRIFHGPGEATLTEFGALSVDYFDSHLWITDWAPIATKTFQQVIEFYHSITPPFADFKAIQSIVRMNRNTVASDHVSEKVWGEPPNGLISVTEGLCSYLVQMLNSKHPGLFLDHAPLRQWLRETQQQKRVLNLFAYTGSLSVAAGLGGAAQITTLDLSKTTLAWAEENCRAAGLPSERLSFYAGDVFDWLPRFKKKGMLFDTILCDPPSFSRSKSGTFSTARDLEKLHAFILPLLAQGGTLVTSINSENLSRDFFYNEVMKAARSQNRNLQLLSDVKLPASFPQQGASYLKGFYLKDTI